MSLSRELRRICSKIFGGQIQSESSVVFPSSQRYRKPTMQTVDFSTLRQISSCHLLVAVPDDGGIRQKTLELLPTADVEFHGQLGLEIAKLKDASIALVFVPPADVLTFLRKDLVDLGIASSIDVAEHQMISDGQAVQQILDLEFEKCELVLRIPMAGTVRESNDLVGKRISTSFINLATKYVTDLEERLSSSDTGHTELRERTRIDTSTGSPEVACLLGVTDAVIGVVVKESVPNKSFSVLKSIDTILNGSAVLVAPLSSSKSNAINKFASRLEGLIGAGKFVLCKYNIERANLKSALDITPGRRAPSVTALEWKGDESMAVSVMVEKEKAVVVLDELIEAGAKDILILRLSDCRVS